METLYCYRITLLQNFTYLWLDYKIFNIREYLMLYVNPFQYISLYFKNHHLFCRDIMYTCTHMQIMFMCDAFTLRIPTDVFISQN